MLDVDVAIVGGGLVGSSLAAALATHPLSKSLSVALIDPHPPDITSFPPLQPRTSTITPSSKQFLDDIGVWEHLPETRIARFDKMFIWDHPRPLPLHESHDFSNSPAGTLVFDSQDIDQEVLGYVVDNATLRNALFRRMDALSKESGLRIISSAVDNIAYNDGETAGGDDSPNFPLLMLSDSNDAKTLVRARLIAACDGARSKTRTLANGDWFSRGYHQSAVVANVLLKDESMTAYQRFVSTGPVAVLPLSTDETSAPVGNIVWTTTPAEAEALVECDDAQFIDELNVVLSGDEDTIEDSGQTPKNAGDALWASLAKGLQLLPGYEPPAQILQPPQATRLQSGRFRFPLKLGHAPRYVLAEKRTVLVGDAAHAVHPLAGQGVNMGFGDADTLASCIARAAGTGRDFGAEDGACLAGYEGERIIANLGMMGLLHGLVGVFGAGRLGRGVRRVGISGVNAVDGVKQGILRVMR